MFTSPNNVLWPTAQHFYFLWCQPFIEDLCFASLTKCGVFFLMIGPISYMPHLLEAKITGSAISYLFHDSFIFYHYHERFKLPLYITLTLLATTTGFIHFESKNAVTI